MALGREAVSWSEDVWSRIDNAVHDEVQRTAVASAFIPMKAGQMGATTVPSARIDLSSMTIDPASVIPVVELALGFGLTLEQVVGEAALETGLTLAVRAANLIAQVEDLLIFQGDKATPSGILGGVQVRGGVHPGLLGAAAAEILVTPIAPAAPRYGERTFEAVVQAVSMLRAEGEAGPYALALSAAVYADTFVPIDGTLVMPADQIRPLVTGGFFEAGGLPAGYGLLASVGGRSVDLVMTAAPATAFVQVDDAGNYLFRVFERWSLRINDPAALVRLAFKS